MNHRIRSRKKLKGNLYLKSANLKRFPRHRQSTIVIITKVTVTTMITTKRDRIIPIVGKQTQIGRAPNIIIIIFIITNREIPKTRRSNCRDQIKIRREKRRVRRSDESRTKLTENVSTSEYHSLSRLRPVSSLRNFPFP